MTVMRRCLGGCGTLVKTGRCATCRAEKERLRGSPSKRGYGTAHRNARMRLAVTLPTLCGYCSQLVRSGDQWVAAHVRDGKPEYGWMVAHPACNERAKDRYRAVAERGVRL